MLEHDTRNELAIRFSRLDEADSFSTVSPHSIFLDEKEWPTVEHYFQANIVLRDPIREQILKASSGIQAHDLGNKWYRKKIKGWKKVRQVLMTRALYTKCQMYDDVRARLLETGDQKIIETSLYDHYWGLGRDQRGENMLGKLWMNVRAKLRSEVG